jgi:two-component system response regulator MprA
MNGSDFLIVAERDDDLAGFLCGQLVADGYPLDRARSVGHAHRLCALRDPAALIVGTLDEEHGGLGLLRSIRTGSLAGGRVAPDLPAVVVREEDSQLGMLRAFDAGADDVLVRPVAYLELRARLEAILRRCRPPARRVLRAGPLTLDPDAGVVRVHGERVGLTRIELSLLVRLALDPERVVTKAQLLREVWGYELPGRTRSVDAAACRLRHKLARAGARTLVVSIRGVGYRLLPVADGSGEARDAA